MNRHNFDPTNVQDYHGRTFVTKSGSRYGITDEGKFHGRPSIEGADILMVAGIETGLYTEVLSTFDGKNTKANLDKLILEHGQQPRQGLHLILSLTEQAYAEKHREGFISSLIEKVE